MKNYKKWFTSVILAVFFPSVFAKTPIVNNPLDVKFQLEKILMQKNELPPAVVYFAHIYSITTDSILNRIENHRIVDSANVSRLITRFGKTFFHACYSSQEQLKAEGNLAWYNAFYANSELSKMQQLQLAINAHINYDLSDVLAHAYANQQSPPESDLLQVNEIFKHISISTFDNFCKNTGVAMTDRYKMSRWIKAYVNYAKYSRKKADRFARKMAKGSESAHKRKNERAIRLSQILVKPPYPIKKIFKLAGRYESDTPSGFISDLNPQ